MIIHRLIFSPIEVNTYILEDKSGECVIIDCGCYDDSEFSMLDRFLEEKKLRPALLLNTHCHLDHIFGNKHMLEKYNLRAWFNKLDELNRELAVNHAAMFGLEMEVPPVPAGYLNDGEIVKSGSIELKALLVPGHTSGSLAFYCEKDNCVFTGDALFNGSIGRSDLPGGDHDTLIRSIKTRLFSLPGDTIVYPGHGDKTDIKSEMTFNPYFA